MLERVGKNLPLIKSKLNEAYYPDSLYATKGSLQPSLWHQHHQHWLNNLEWVLICPRRAIRSFLFLDLALQFLMTIYLRFPSTWFVNLILGLPFFFSPQVFCGLNILHPLHMVQPHQSINLNCSYDVSILKKA